MKKHHRETFYEKMSIPVKHNDTSESQCKTVYIYSTQQQNDSLYSYYIYLKYNTYTLTALSMSVTKTSSKRT